MCLDYSTNIYLYFAILKMDGLKHNIFCADNLRLPRLWTMSQIVLLCLGSVNILVSADISATTSPSSFHSSDSSSSQLLNHDDNPSQFMPISSPKSQNVDIKTPKSECTSLQICNNEFQPGHPIPKTLADYNCHELDFCDDMLGFEAILSLHRQLDDDANGNIDISESDEFLRDELKYENGVNDRAKAFHGNDKHITVEELWRSWRMSAVHNWTVEETVDWLCNIVELPQYKTKFELQAIDGIALPRLASNPQFFGIIGINNIIHRQKLSLKATDVVLFGVPRPSSLTKDLVMLGLLIFAIAVGWYAFVQHKYSQTHLRKMMKDMEALSSAEKQLESLQVELNKTKQEHENAYKEKRDLERQLKQKERILGITAGGAAATNGSIDSCSDVDNQSCLVDDRVAELEVELNKTQEELKRYQTAYAMNQWIPPLQLQAYLQLSYEIETKHFNAKKAAAEMQMHAAREEYDKVKKKRATVFGAFRIANGSSIDYLDNTILQARTLMGELTKEMRERINRWQTIERFCGFEIILNPGYALLEKTLYGVGSGAGSNSLQSPTMTTSSTATIPTAASYHLFPRNTSEATLVENESMDSSSLSSNYHTVGGAIAGQAMWQNSPAIPMHMRKASANILHTNYPSPLSSAIAFSEQSSLDEDGGGLSMRAPSDDFGGQAIISRRISATVLPVAEAGLRSKTVAMSQIGSAIPPHPKARNFRRGSSDGVERYFDQNQLRPIDEFNAMGGHTLNNNNYQQTYNTIPAHNAALLQQMAKQANSMLTNNGSSSLESPMDEHSQVTSAIILPITKKPSSFDMNGGGDDITSSSSESSATTLSYLHKKATPLKPSDLVNSDSPPSMGSPSSSSKKRHIFSGFRRRKSKTDSKKDA